MNANVPAPAAQPLPRAPVHWAQTVLELCSSLKVTVVLLLAFGVLTFAGTVAQTKLGLFVAQRDFFESFWVVWDTEVPFGRDLTLRIPWPGGYSIMLALFVNLVVGGIVRHRWHWRNAGILVTHLGIALLLIAGFVKLHFSYAGHVALYEGDQASTMSSVHDYELALLRLDGDSIVERTVASTQFEPGARGPGGVTVTADDLPFTIVVSNWLDNCEPRQKGPMVEARLPVVTDAAGAGHFLEQKDVDPERERNIAGCYVRIVERVGRKEHQTILRASDFGPNRRPYTFRIDGVTWGLDLRRILWDLPFPIRLDKFQKTDHPGTITPRDFSSWVTVFDGDVERKVHIYMNHPLRSHDHVFFQTSWGPQDRGVPLGPPWYSVFEVAKNPSDDWPKYASYVVFAGLLLHFTAKLLRYLQSSTRKASLPEMS
ncbi:MAG TPA: cytochrome c biogenesis protein ResB [Planctomycetota bacterium]|nr:cytochrome c biogenesis protein ResB [Planctomycetota bacterium]